MPENAGSMDTGSIGWESLKITIYKNEIWDGERWHELQWFWDPSSTFVLPTCCSMCGIPIKSKYMINSPDGDNEHIKMVQCPLCFEELQCRIEQAILEGGVDGIRSQGAQRRKWTDDVKDWFIITDYGSLKRLSEDREARKLLIDNLRLP